MIRFITFLISATIITSCASSKKTVSDVVRIDSFLTKFEKAVLQNDTQALMEMMDADYRKEQHDEMLGGRTDLFLDELFCGNRIDESEFKCFKLKEIVSIQRKKVEETELGHTVKYTLANSYMEITTELLVLKKFVDGRSVFGIEGARG